jgi:hypothetical protein
MRSQLFVKSIDLHPNPSNFEIGIVIRYANWLLVYNTIGQRIGYLNELEHQPTFSSLFYFTKQVICVVRTDGNLYEFNYKFDLLRSKKTPVDFFDKIHETEIIANLEIRFNDFMLQHLFCESMFDYFEVLSKCNAALHELHLSHLFNKELFIDFLAVKNLMGLGFSSKDVHNTFVREITQEMKRAVENGESEIKCKSMSEYIYYYFSQYSVVKQASALNF